ncbi:hypothetical protein QBC35DRAFT_545578 [Podospora australis]|uniref:Uncharacterized protein n=1 Tax=Podospora australis TaxID=1536484 RepID=A0AAN6WJN4_9PEZI|nr:hypothetical protein QBC35DRAFT_545578 [Podospora australis]
MAIDGSTIAAILTGILALVGAVTTAWMSGLNQQRVESRKNRKALAHASVPLLIASWDLANWLYDILEPIAYSPKRCKAYGDGWPNDFTSYLFGGVRAEQLKKLPWKIQDEFISMHYEGRENLPLRWTEKDTLHVQEAMTLPDGDGGIRAMRWVEFLKEYTQGLQLKERFKMEWKREGNPQEGRNPREDRKIKQEGDHSPAVVVVIPDHRARRLQHLLSDLVVLLDEVSGMKFNRPMRRCEMVVTKQVLASGTSDTYMYRIPCDCFDEHCNWKQKDFQRRQLQGRQPLEEDASGSVRRKVTDSGDKC